MEKANNDDSHPNVLGDESQPGASGSETRPIQIEDERKPLPVSSRLDTDIHSNELPEQEGDLTAADDWSTSGSSAPYDTDAGGSSSGDEPPRKEVVSSRRWFWLFLVGIIALIMIASGSAYAGYHSGVQQRENFEATLVANEAQQQFELGLRDIEAGRYDIARQRFEYVIRINPNYPGVTEQLAIVLLELNTTATPTPVPTPTITPTPDMRGVEELFSQAQMLLADQQWEQAIETLLNLRKEDPDFHAIKVDGMLYVALRNLGVRKILQDADLEGGTYDLALAESFGPIDVEARNYSTWANLYVTGASFWDLNWREASYYFGQLIQAAPNLRDATNITATERFRIATLNYAQFLIEIDEWCLAQEQFQRLLALNPNPAVEPTATWVAERCEQAQQEPEEPTPEPTEDDENGSTEEPDETPTPESTQGPTSTPTP
jgi:tetratricopeptide (TPR) repeat protein